MRPINSQPDIIVVGGGSAGCAVAGRLAQSGKVKVLLIEAGASKRNMKTTIPAGVAGLVMNPDYDWMYQVEPDAARNGKPDLWPAGKVIGGGSAINGMMYVRGHADDYDRWRDRGAEGWGYKDVLPYFRRLENNPRPGPFHGSDGPVRVSEARLDYAITHDWIRAAETAGVPRCADLNGDGAKAIGVDTVQQSQYKGRRWSAADAYIRSQKLPNLAVLDNARVERIVVESGKAIGVVVSGSDGTLRTLPAKKGVVLSAGTMASPKLLMLSGIGPGERLREYGVPVLVDAPEVGSNLQEHVGINLNFAVRSPTINSEVKGLGAVKSIIRYFLSGRGPLSTGIGTAQAIVRLDNTLASAVQLAFSPFSFEITPEGERILSPYSGVTLMAGVLHPASRGSVTLISSDPKAPPLIQHTLFEQQDLALLCRAVELLREIMTQAPIANLIVRETRPGPGTPNGPELARWIADSAIPLFHPIGTCRMGSDAKSVVTPDLQVRGVENLWVADSSIAPGTVSGNTNAMALMIGEKASDHILQRLSQASHSDRNLGRAA